MSVAPNGGACEDDVSWCAAMVHKMARDEVPTTHTGGGGVVDVMSPMLMAVEIAERVMRERALLMQLQDAEAEVARLREENRDLRETIEQHGTGNRGASQG